MLVEDRLIARFGGNARTWRWRKRLRALSFRMSRGLFTAGYTAEETTVRVRTVPLLLRNAVVPVLLALAIVVAMDLLNGSVHDLIKGWHWGTLSSSGSYDILLETAAATTGVFLALYFTAVSTVAANVYVSVPHDIRALLVKDRLSNVYVTGVAFTMALSVLLLIAHALTGRAYWLAPPVIGLFSAFSIFAFVRLGQRAFYLADPTLLANTLAYDFASWFRRAQAGRRRSRDPSFQEHYRQQARASIASLVSLLAIANDQPHLRGGSLRQLAIKITAVLSGYLTSRDRVPTKSRWFGERYEHKQWYLAESTEIETATRTASALQPRSVPDVSWVEDMILPALIDLVDADLEHADYEGAYSVLERLSSVWSRLGERWSEPTVERWTNLMTPRLFERLSQVDPATVPRPALVPAIWDALSMLPLSAELGFHGDVLKRTVDSLVTTLDEADWTDPRAPYNVGVPRPVIDFLEKVQAGREFEQAVEAPGSTRTPSWYVREVSLNLDESAFKEQIEAHVSLLTSWYTTHAQNLFDAQQPDACGAVLSRAIEVAWKLERHLDDWEQRANALRRPPLLISLNRPTWNWQQLRDSVQDFRNAVLGQLANSIKLHVARQRVEEMPDYLGQAVHTLGEACVQALQENNADLFDALFPTYFAGVLAVVGRIEEEVVDWQQKTMTTAIAEPVEDLLDVSGYALIFSELHDEPRYREMCVEKWRIYARGADGLKRITIIAALHAFENGLFAITHRATLRTRWQMNLEHQLNALPRDPSSSPFHEGEVQHPSALIRRIAGSGGIAGTMMYKPADIFVVRFLRTLAGAGALDFGINKWIVEALDDLGDGEEGDDE